MSRVFVGQIVHTKSLNEFEIFSNGFLAIDNNKITAIGEDYATWRKENPLAEEEILTPRQFLMPGFVDCHIHAPQVAQIGLGLDMELLDWLNTYTFPLEANFNDTNFALDVYQNVVRTTLRNGTTLAAYFGTNHKESTLVLAKEAIRQGQRAFVGKVCSNRNSPSFYVETLENSISETKTFLEEFKTLKSNIVQPIITPRFAISCTEELLTELGNIAKKDNLNIQSHISESVSEVKFVKELFNKKSYTEVYYDAGLLNSKTIMAHGVHLEDDEITLFEKTGASIAHCPSSNTNLSSGLCDVRRLLDSGVKVGLGTDVSGGNSMSIQNAILRTLDVSHHIEFVKKQDIKGTARNADEVSIGYKPLNYKQAIFLATLGGAQALSVGHLTGNFAIGKEFDALLVDTSLHPIIDCNLFGRLQTSKTYDDKILELVQQFVYVGDDRNIVKVFVSGKQVK